MFNSGVPQFTQQTKYLRNTRTASAAFASPKDGFKDSMSCVAAIIFRNEFVTMKVSMYTIHGTNSVALSCKERKYGRCC